LDPYLKCSFNIRYKAGSVSDYILRNSLTRIVLTGAPASGKTELFESLKVDPRFESFVFFDELARRLLEENPGYRQNWHQFHLDIYARQVKREAEVSGKNFVTDRGTVDAFAFHPETIEAVNTSLEAEYERYSAVFHLGSAANLGERYYVRDTIRTEPIAEALAIEKAIRHVWENHPAYRYFQAESDANTKLARCIELIESLVV